jgi:response regulator RpfG family c-di-GMP phosphodiesterase
MKERNAASRPDEQIGLERIESCLDHLADSLESLAAISVLEPAQADAVSSAVAPLIEDRKNFVTDFATAFTRDELLAYRTAHRQFADEPEDPQRQIDDALLDEALHYFALLRLAQGCESDSAGHLERTANYCRHFAEHLGCEPLFVEDLVYAARLHDVGLIAVPSEILAKRGVIDSNERLLLDTHTRAGAYLVNSIIDRLWLEDGPLLAAHEVALYHHERHDGYGVLGLRGESIPFAARVFQFGDAYDALRRVRPHRPPLAHDQAVARMREANANDAVQFDPQLFDAFHDCAQEFARIHDQTLPANAV